MFRLVRSWVSVCSGWQLLQSASSPASWQWGRGSPSRVGRVLRRLRAPGLLQRLAPGRDARRGGGGVDADEGAAGTSGSGLAPTLGARPGCGQSSPVCPGLVGCGVADCWQGKEKVWSVFQTGDPEQTSGMLDDAIEYCRAPMPLPSCTRSLPHPRQMENRDPNQHHDRHPQRPHRSRQLQNQR